MRLHNRHGTTGFIRLDPHLCRACWKCVKACQRGVIGKINLPFHKHARLDNPIKCKGCLKCVKACPQEAIAAYRINDKVTDEVTP